MLALPATPSLAGSLATAARLLSLMADSAVLGDCIDQLIATTAEQGFPHWGAEGAVYRGWVAVKNGHVAKGILLLRSGVKPSRQAIQRAPSGETPPPRDDDVGMRMVAYTPTIP